MVLIIALFRQIAPHLGAMQARPFAGPVTPTINAKPLTMSNGLHIDSPAFLPCQAQLPITHHRPALARAARPRVACRPVGLIVQVLVTLHFCPTGETLLHSAANNLTG